MNNDPNQLLVVDHSSAVSKPQDPHLSHLSHVSSTSSKTYRPYRYRFVITLLFCLVGMINAIMWICTSPITTNLEKIYGLDIFAVTFCTSIIWFLVYPFMNFVTNYVLDEKGLQVGVIAGGTLTIIGLWIRTLNNISFYFIFAGQLLGAIGQPFLMNAPQKLSAVWYAPQERALATTIASVANPVGVGVGFLMAQNFVDVDAEGEDGKHQVNKLMMFTAILGSVLILPIYFLFKKKPPTPPSKSADTDKYSYKESLKHLLSNKNYLLCIVSIGLVWGSFNVMATALQPLVTPYNFTSVDSGNLGAITLVSGLIGSVVWGLFVDRTKKFKLSIVCCAVLDLVSLGALSFTLQYESFGLTAAITAIYGFFATPIFPIAYEMGAELSFPVAEAAAGGLMVVMTQIVGLGGTLGLDALLKDEIQVHSQICLAIVGGLTVIGLIGLLLVKEDLRRTRMEQEGEDLGVPEDEKAKKTEKKSNRSSKTKSLVHPVDEPRIRDSLLAKGL